MIFYNSFIKANCLKLGVAIMNNFFAGAEVITIYSLQDALDDGVIICLSSKEEHANDCKKFYKFPFTLCWM